MSPSMPLMPTAVGSAPSSPAALADATVNDILRTQWQGVAALRLDSPPGAGKTGVVERLAGQALGLMGERCAIATQTNQQAFDLMRRLGQRYVSLRFWLLTKKRLPVPAVVRALPNVTVVDDVMALPPGPCVVVANAARWSWVSSAWTKAFDVLVVDEAFQLPDFRFLQIAGLARRVVLVGDPGQIDPIVRGQIERWAGDAAGPHIACPEALIARYPRLARERLPVSRRLPPDTVATIQPAFYPDLPFTALSAPGDRALRTASGGSSQIDRAIDLAVAGATLIQVELPPLMTGEYDPEAADTIVRTVEQLLARGASIVDDGATRRLTPDMIGVACAHVSQANAVRERLATSLAAVSVDTGNRWQGLERPVMLVHHPLSGRGDASSFHLDAGRLCVMLSRHRVVCIVVTRGGVVDVLRRYSPEGNRPVGVERDAEYEGWRAHLTLQDGLRAAGRVVAA